jgi:hypothetical protein
MTAKAWWSVTFAFMAILPAVTITSTYIATKLTRNFNTEIPFISTSIDYSPGIF